MDTTPKYVEMCKKAEEINYPHYQAHYQDIEDGFIKSFRAEVNDQLVWLPRQDQLQEMIDWSGYSYVVSTQVAQINDFYNTLKEVPDSMEQLWLAFVMKEKYNKVWNGKDWVKK